MTTYSLSHLSDRALLRDLASLVARDRNTTAALLAHLAEVDARKLYLPAAYPSMYAYCVGELRLSEDAAYKRIQAARSARQFPAIFDAVAQGRLHLTGVGMLASYLTRENAEELLKAAEHKTKGEIESLLAERFPRSESLPVMEVIPVPAQVEPARSKLVAMAPERVLLQLAIGRGTHDKLRYAQELLGHQIPSRDVAEVIDRALDALIPKLEKTKFAATSRPRHPQPRSTAGGRHVPADVRRTVWARDGGRCTFVSEAGRRCSARTRLEFDHIDEVARGGRATAERMWLRCRAHNQYGAECTFGVEFMRHKRQEARQAAGMRGRAAAHERAQEVIPWLRALGFRADEARRAAAFSEAIPDAPPGQRVRVALSYLAPRGLTRRAAPA